MRELYPLDDPSADEDATIKWLEDGEDRAEIESLLNRGQLDVLAGKFDGSPILAEEIAIIREASDAA